MPTEEQAKIESPTQWPPSPEIVWGRIPVINTYEVTEDELEQLEKGTASSIHLNFSIFLLSVALTCLITLRTATFSDGSTTEVFFIVLTVVGFFGGVFLLLLWYRDYTSTSEVVQKIKRRLPTERQDVKTVEESD